MLHAQKQVNWNDESKAYNLLISRNSINLRIVQGQRPLIYQDTV